MNRLEIAVDQVPKGHSVRIDHGRLRLAVFHTESGFHVIDDRCSHAEASLSEGDVFADEVECPRHGAVFDLLTGEALSLPAVRPVNHYDVSVEDGVVAIVVPEEDV